MTAPELAQSMLSTRVSRRRRQQNGLSTPGNWLPKLGACKSSLDSQLNSINCHSVGMTFRVRLSTSAVFLQRSCSSSALSCNRSRLTDQWSISAFVSSQPLFLLNSAVKLTPCSDGRWMAEGLLLHRICKTKQRVF